MKSSFLKLLLLLPLMAWGQSNQVLLSQLIGNRHVFFTGNQSPVSGSLFQVDHLFESLSPTYPLDAEGGAWSNTGYIYAGFSTTVTNTTVPGQGSSAPLVGLFSFINNNGATANAVSIIGDAVARTNNSSVFGANFIARNVSGTTGTVLRGLEVDVEPASGTTISGNGAGGFFNAFSIAMPVPVMQFGGVSGGTWANGVMSSHITGTHYGVVSGDPTTAASFINTANGTFSGAAIILGIGATQEISLGGAVFGTNPALYADSSNNLNVQLGAANAVIFRNATGTQISALANTGLQLQPFTVSTLPGCGTSAPAGSLAYVTDQNGSPTYRGSLTGGGALKVPVFCNGSSWEAH